MIRVFHLQPDDDVSSFVADNERWRVRGAIAVGEAAILDKVYRDIASGMHRGLRLQEVARIAGDDRARAFDITNSLERNWFEVDHEDLEVVGCANIHRSTSVADLMVQGDRAYIVAGMGYIEIESPVAALIPAQPAIERARA